MTTRWIAALLISALPVSPAYALRQRGADSPATRTAIESGLEEHRHAAPSKILAMRTVVAWLRAELSIWPFLTKRQMAGESSKASVAARDLTGAIQEALVLVKYEELDNWRYRDLDVTIAGVAHRQAELGTIRAQAQALLSSNAPIESVIEFLEGVVYGSGDYQGYRGTTLDYRALEERLTRFAELDGTEITRKVRAIRLGILLDEPLLEAFESELQIAETRLRPVLAAAGLEGLDHDVTLRRYRKPSYAAFIIAPHGISAIPTAALAYHQHSIPFRMVVLDDAQREALIQTVKDQHMDRLLPNDWEQWIIQVDRASGYYPAYVRARTELLGAGRDDKTLIVRGAMDQALKIPNVDEIVVPVLDMNRKTMPEFLERLAGQYGCTIYGMDALLRATRALKEQA